MGKVTGFIEFKRDKQPYRPVAERRQRLASGDAPLAGRQAPEAGGAVHGLRHPVLPPGLPARQPHPRLERPRLPGPLARGHRPAARHQQLPRVHGDAVPRALRGLLRPRHQRRSGDHQGHRAHHRRSRLRAGLDRAGAAGGADGQEGGGHRLGARGTRRRPAAQPRRPLGDRARAGRSHRRAAPLRHPRVQDGKARARPATRPDERRGRALRDGPPRRRERGRRGSPARSSTRSSSRGGRPRRGIFPSPAASSPEFTSPWST